MFTSNLFWEFVKYSQDCHPELDSGSKSDSGSKVGMTIILFVNELILFN